MIIAPIIEPGQALTVWTANATTLEWSPDPSTTIQFSHNTGSPEPALLATSADRVVVAAPFDGGSGQTILVGQASSP